MDQIIDPSARQAQQTARVLRYRWLSGVPLRDDKECVHRQLVRDRDHQSGERDGISIALLDLPRASRIPLIDRLRQRFAVGRVCAVADRGMISAPTIASLEERGLEFILGLHERSSKEAQQVVLNDPAPSVALVFPRYG